MIWVFWNHSFKVFDARKTKHQLAKVPYKSQLKLIGIINWKKNSTQRTVFIESLIVRTTECSFF